ncbi:hypothetical protein N7539_006777 [Penicillium diatomitis]|uniref:Uncharacterized protein n=1 Tax=Penicillium diatomitis TaxID=2819901 RepID=A0A9W9X1Y7_9EURO|nr:uncharacterized protein N7539_006777 [Penicillium diatomitis]KAJ5480883.1 hypothetical protein N7539_006777 [Penicillium diatomitis]
MVLLTKNKDRAYPFSLDFSSREEDEPREVNVKDIKAQFFFEQPEEKLIPTRFLEMAEASSEWICAHVLHNFMHEDKDKVDFWKWPIFDLRWRETFRSLIEVPKLKLGAWEGGVEQCFLALAEGNRDAQADVLYHLMEDIWVGMTLNDDPSQGMCSLELKPRLFESTFSYLTGYREKHRDGPQTEGMMSTSYTDAKSPTPIAPFCITNYEEPMDTALSDRFKVILGQLSKHARILPVPGDRIPDQEVFVLGQHGSKVHLMRAFFPGWKLSSIWCGRELRRPAARNETPSPSSSRGSSPSNKSSPPQSSSSPAASSTWKPEDEPAKPEAIHPSKAQRAASKLKRFYSASNIRRVLQRFEATKRKVDDSEFNIRSFRVDCTHEYDLWKKEDFTAAVRVLLALYYYLQSGDARCGILMVKNREKFDFGPESSSPDRDTVDETKTEKSPPDKDANEPNHKDAASCDDKGSKEQPGVKTPPSGLSEELEMLRLKASKSPSAFEKRPEANSPSQDDSEQSACPWFTTLKRSPRGSKRT